MYSVVFQHEPGYGSSAGIALPFLSLNTQRFRLPGLGIVGLDPVVMIDLPVVNIPTTGPGSWNTTVPNDPALQNLRFFLQALIGLPAAPVLSNVVATRIL